MNVPLYKSAWKYPASYNGPVTSPRIKSKEDWTEPIQEIFDGDAAYNLPVS
jgi:hypothetical protein